MSFLDGSRLIICHLYPDLLNLYGDRGNIIALKRRAQWRGIETEVRAVSLQDRVDFTQFDIVFIGGGQDREQNLIYEDFQQVKGGSLAEAVEDGISLLAICGGYQLLGYYYKTWQGDQMPGLGILDVRTEAGKKRLIGNILVESEIFPDGRHTLVGFENHSGKTYLGERATPLGKVLNGFGNNGEDGKEGAVYKHAIGTYLHGSLLPKNPWLTDLFLKWALERRYGGVINLPSLDDTLEVEAHEAAAKRVNFRG